MPSYKTEATELSVGFGVLGIENPGVSDLDIKSLFGETLVDKTYRSYLLEFESNQKLYTRFIHCGNRLRDMLFRNVENVHWTGRQQQASTSMVSQDLFVPSFNMPISVKNESNVVANLSAHNLFRSLPSGEVVVTKSDDWFIEKDLPGLQTLYQYARRHFSGDLKLPEDIIEFYRSVNRLDRKDFRENLRALKGEEYDEFNKLYVSMCNQVAMSSADEFNKRLSSLRSNARTAVSENFVKQFFRINHVPYVLTGIDHKQDFGVRIPDITSWKREWIIQGIRAEARKGGQSMVNISLSMQNKRDQSDYSASFRVEIRWSHGKFCGNPESKLYKEFLWRDVPFFQVLF